jgi:hypothetical protein
MMQYTRDTGVTLKKRMLIPSHHRFLEHGHEVC